jgi:outer membrane protein
MLAIKIFCIICSVLILAYPVQAIDLATAYKKATAYDSELATALAARNATAESVTIVKSGLLPAVAAGASVAHNDTDRDSGFSDGYTTKGASVSVIQPLLKLDTYHDFKASEFAEFKADADYVDAQQNLLFRTGNTYFSVLRAWDNLVTTKRAEEAFKRQWEQAKERFEVGLIAITEVHESKAIYDSAKVARINAVGELDVSLEKLQRITGEYTERILTLSPDYPITLDTSKSISDWEELAFAHNPLLQAAKFSVRSAQSNVSARHAGHYPTIEAEASYSYSDFNGPNPANDQSTDTAIALNFSMPLYTGGGTEARVRQARQQLEQARQALNTTQRNIRVQIRSLYRTLRTNVEAIQARKQQTVSTQSALEATRAGYDVGTRNIVEVLDAERQYFVSLSDYSNAIYDYVVNSLSFKQTAGTLSETDILELNSWLKSPVDTSER